LNPGNVRAMVGEVAAQKALSEETIATVLERTGGVPLFVEELTRAVVESGNASRTGHEIPVTLHDSLMARLDRLGSAKEVAQVGAVIGSEFSYELLSAVHPVAEEDLQRALRTLAEAELLYVRGIASEASYQFKHALIRDTAYEALLKSRRRDLHRLVARTINDKFSALKEAQPEVLARHWTEAGETEPAIAEWSRAGESARARNAFSEALESCRQALALLNSLPESSGRDLRELELRQSVVQVLQVTSGHSAPETADAIARAAALAEKTGNLTQLVGSMITRGFTVHFSGDLPAAGALADQALELALHEGSPTHLALVYLLQTETRRSRGDLAGAEKYYAAGCKFFDDPGFRHVAGAVSGVFAYASLNAWALGRIDVARQRMARAEAAADGDNPYEVAFSKYVAAMFSVYMKEYENAEALAERALELSEKHQFNTVAAYSRWALGQARAQLGRASEGVALIRHGLAGLGEVGTRLGISLLTASLAEAQESGGSIVEALQTVEQALQVNPDLLAPRPEMFRLRGALRFKLGQAELAEADFCESIALAQRMSAKTLELRATMSLARLLAQQNKRGEARTMLAEIYNWFTEGFDTRDLKDAKALLDELNE